MAKPHSDEAPFPGLFGGVAKFGRVGGPASPVGLPSAQRFLDRSPATIENMFSSDDASLRKSAVPMLVGYLRSHDLPMLNLLADWLDPNSPNGPRWKLVKRRGRGKKLANDRQWRKDAEIVWEVRQALKAQGARRPSIKKARGEVAKKRGLSDHAIKAAERRVKGISK